MSWSRAISPRQVALLGEAAANPAPMRVVQKLQGSATALCRAGLMTYLGDSWYAVTAAGMSYAAELAA